MSPASTFLIDPNKLFREGLKAVFRDSDFGIDGEAGSLEEAVPGLTSGARPRIILLDSTTLGQGTVQIAGLRSLCPESRLVVLTANLDPAAFMAALAAGVDGYLMKSLSPEALLQSLRLVLAGEKVLPTSLAELLVSGRLEADGLDMRRPKAPSLRETQILKGLLQGQSNKEIARALGITESTVKVHLKGLLRRIGCANRTQAALWALNNGIGEDPSRAGNGQTTVA